MDVSTLVTAFAPDRRDWLTLPVGVSVGVGIVALSPFGWELDAMLAITVFCISLWITTPVPTWYTSLIGIGLIGLLFSPDLALQGFMSPAVWLIVLGLLMGDAIRQSGLANQTQAWVLRRLPDRVLTDGRTAYRALLVVLCALGAAFAIVVPSALVRVLIYGPILKTIGDAFESREAKVGLFLGPLFSTYFAGVGILTGSLVNVIIVNLAKDAGSVAITWTEWALYMFPVLTVGRIALIAAVTYYLYRPPADETITADLDVEYAHDAAPRRMLVFLAAGVGIWVTDFVHGLDPLFGAFVVVALAFSPALGVIDFERIESLDFSIVFFLGAILAIAEGLMRAGFDSRVTGFILEWMPADTSLLGALLAVVVITIPLTFLMAGLASASVLTPVFVAFSESVGVPVVPVVMAEAMALGVYFFPYQSAVLVAILSLDVVGPRELISVTSIITIATILTLFPLQFAVFVLLF